MEHHHPLRRAKLREAGLQLECFVHGFPHEALHDVFPPRLKRSLSEAAPQSLGSGKADAVDLQGVAIEQGHSGLGEDAFHLTGLARLVVVIAEHGHHRPALGRAQLLGEHPCLFGLPKIREIAAENENVGRLGHGRE